MIIPRPSLCITGVVTQEVGLGVVYVQRSDVESSLVGCYLSLFGAAITRKKLWLLSWGARVSDLTELLMSACLLPVTSVP